MTRLWKILALLFVITTLVWMVTLWRWQSGHVSPTSTDVVLNLAVLPVVLTVALFSAVLLTKRLRSYAVAPIAAPAATPEPAPAREAQSGVDERKAAFMVLSTAVQVRAGGDWDKACADIASGECKAELDAEFKGGDGMPVFSARVPDLETGPVADAVAEGVPALAARQPEAWSGFECPADVLRALALMDQSLSAMQEALDAQWPALKLMAAGHMAPSSSAAKKPEEAKPAPAVALRVAIPARWSGQVQQAATAWLEQRLKPVIDAGQKAFHEAVAANGARARASAAQPVVHLHVHPVASSEAFWMILDQQLLQWQRERVPGLLLAVAADSLVSPSSFEAWAAANELFSGANPRGRVPGEAAAALLLAMPAWAVASPGAEPPMARLHRAGVALRDKSADASGRIGSQALQQLAADALRACDLDAAKVSHVTSDADHRGSRTNELYETLQALMPHLEPAEQALRLGAGCGDIGIARLPACAALAAAKAQSAEAPVMVLGAFQPIERFAVMLTPGTRPGGPDDVPTGQAAA